ncbi:hypothetical protein L6452_42283 [Arctium lappa]|uniref:Uncharacterized protein n=1 Tax=Arctium lappa TaxID=4217 RepID=A0ACB8XHT8_ARCLA|nr:hypothetical protein L6452_42283 [Arctium lappa]
MIGGSTKAMIGGSSEAMIGSSNTWFLYGIIVNRWNGSLDLKPNRLNQQPKRYEETNLIDDEDKGVANGGRLKVTGVINRHWIAGDGVILMVSADGRNSHAGTVIFSCGSI